MNQQDELTAALQIASQRLGEAEALEPLAVRIEEAAGPRKQGARAPTSAAIALDLRVEMLLGRPRLIERSRFLPIEMPLSQRTIWSPHGTALARSDGLKGNMLSPSHAPCCPAREARAVHPSACA